MARFRSPSRSRSPAPRQVNPRELWREFDEPSMDEHDYARQRDASRERENNRRNIQTSHMKRSGNVKERVEDVTAPKLFWDGFQWVAKATTGDGGGEAAMMNSTRKLRRLYFGNLPLAMGLTETGFQELVWQEMVKRGMTAERVHCPVICVWFAKDKGTYGFVEFGTVEDTDRALGLDGMEVMGVSIKVSRPNDYATTTITGTTTLPPTQAMPLLDPGQTASPFVRLHEVILPTDLEDDETWADALEDIEEGCKQYGTLRASLIITDKLVATAREQSVLLTVKVGDCILEFETPAVADQCIVGMNGRKFNERPVHCEKLSTDDFGHVAPLVALAKALDEGIFRDAAKIAA